MYQFCSLFLALILWCRRESKTWRVNEREKGCDIDKSGQRNTPLFRAHAPSSELTIFFLLRAVVFFYFHYLNS